MHLSWPQAGMTAILLASLASPFAAAAPSFKHSHAHAQPPARAEVKYVNNIHGDSKAGQNPNDLFSNAVIFEHKHQRSFKAAPGDAVVRESLDSRAMAKRGIQDGIIFMTAYDPAKIHHSVPSGLPRFHFGTFTRQSPTGVDFTPIASLDSTSEAATTTPTSVPVTSAASSVAPAPSTTDCDDGSTYEVGASSTQSSSAAATPAAESTSAQPTPASSVTPAEESSAPVSTQVTLPSATFPGKMQPISYANSLATPAVQDTQLLGMVTQEPDMQFINHSNELIPQLASNQLGPGISTLLTTNYHMYNGSGSLIYNPADTMSPLIQTPWMSRDNGKGGYLNGYQIFMYADTGVTILDDNNAFGGFVSTSVAVDKGRMATQGKPPVLQDMMGEWDNSGGLPRGFIPFTLGEAAYTGQSGKRYAIWPESSLIYLDSQTALSYSSIVYIDTAAESLFADVGNTLVKITVPGIGGPVAERSVPLLFGADHINFGGIGGLRSWGKSGPGGSDGHVYLFGKTNNGLHLARVDPSGIEDTSKYEYFNSDTNSWSGTAPAKDATSGYFVDGAYSNVDIFYSPRHLTFVMIFQTPYADNTFYWRYLQAPGPIKPSYAGGDDDDIVENLHKYTWSDGEVLYRAPAPTNGNYIYSGGMQMGYFDDDDIVNGGTKMLIQWTSPTAKSDPHGYDTGTAVVTFA